MQVNLCEPKTRLSELVDQASRGETVIIAKAGTPMAKLVPFASVAKRRLVFGLMKGKIRIADDFDAPLPDDIRAAFEGTGIAVGDAGACGVAQSRLALAGAGRRGLRLRGVTVESSDQGCI